MNSSARSLTFNVIDRPDGCLLQGSLQPSFWMKLYRWFFLAMLCVYSVIVLTDVVRHHLDKLPSSVAWLGVMFVGFIAFINAYTWIATLFTRRIERTLLKSVEYVVRDDASAAIAADLLSSSR